MLSKKINSLKAYYKIIIAFQEDLVRRNYFHFVFGNIFIQINLVKHSLVMYNNRRSYIKKELV